MLPKYSMDYNLKMPELGLVSIASITFVTEINFDDLYLLSIDK